MCNALFLTTVYSCEEQKAMIPDCRLRRVWQSLDIQQIRYKGYWLPRISLFTVRPMKNVKPNFDVAVTHLVD